ncbi:fh, isoform B [Drosophila yakuba]|uniref:Fh, isoform B n=1 Tax=Drosophila yakuba TaxID=7245 RepID=A0A0R1EHP7_DROYA|nr:fh, isoform B [Drosophila yakuba]
MFAGRLLVRLSRSRACLATIGSWSKPQALANQMILPRTPPTSTNAIQCKGSNANRRFFSSEIETESTLDGATYERVCSDTLDALSDYFEELTENAAELQGTDVAYSVGWRAHRESGTPARHLCDQPADAQQTDLAQFAHQRSQAIRFRRHRGGGQMGLQAQWSVAARTAAAGNTRHSEVRVRGLPPPALL